MARLMEMMNGGTRIPDGWQPHSSWSCSCSTLYMPSAMMMGECLSGEDDFYRDSAAGYIDTLKKNITQGEWSEQVSRVGQHAARTRLHVQTQQGVPSGFEGCSSHD